MAAIKAQRVAQMKAMAKQVQQASGTPNPTGNGTHRWSGVVRGGNVSNAQYTPPTPAAPSQPQSMLSTQRRPAPAQRPALTGSNPALKLNTTTTPVDGQALAKQIQQMQQQPSPPPAPSSTPSASAWANQTNSQSGPLSSPMSSVSTSFNNATGQQDPPHIITTDNGRKFNTQTKQFLDGRPGGFAR
jgi:hypothetical protein